MEIGCSGLPEIMASHFLAPGFEEPGKLLTQQFLIDIKQYNVRFVVN